MRGVLHAVVAVGLGAMPALAAPQHQGHQTVPPSVAAHAGQCAQAQPAVEHIIVGATARLESARQSNEPAEMRAAIEHFQSALRDLRTQLAPCAAAASSADPHAGHAMPAAPPTAAPPPDPHAGHTMPAPPATKTSPPAARPKAAAPKAAPQAAAPDPHAGHAAPAPKKPASRPAPPKRTEPKATDSHAGHDHGAPPVKKDAPSVPEQRDPVTGLMVDPATAPKTTYQGQTYYFSSEASRKEFLENPAKFARKPKG